jgi:hypothetical protein
MKLLTKLLIPLLLLLLLLGALLFLPIFGDPLVSLDSLLWSREERFSSREIVEQIRDVYELQTVEYVYRMVFPHDFYPEDLSLRAVFDRLAEGQGAPEEVLSPEELAFLRAYNLAYESGLPTTPEGDSFVVVTARVRGGYSAEDPSQLQELFRVEAVTGSDAGEQAPEDESLTPEESRVVVLLPEAEVVEVLIEDLNRENYPYPAAMVDAEEWREISSFVAEEARRRTVEEGILREAEENARVFLTTLLTEAGFAQIRFALPERKE